MEALETFRRVFTGFAVAVSDGGVGTNTMIVRDRHPDQPLAIAGLTRSSSQSNLYLGLATNNAWSWGKELNKTRDEYITAIGRGLGQTGAHEFIHQIYFEANEHDRHSRNGDYINWSAPPGSSERFPWQLSYGQQKLPGEIFEFLKTRIPYGN